MGSPRLSAGGGWSGVGRREALEMHTLAGLGVAELLALLVQWSTLWLGLYLIGRTPRSRATTLTGAAIVVLAFYQLAVALTLLSPIPPASPATYAREIGAWIPFAPVLILHAVLYITGLSRRRWRPVLVALYVSAGAVAALFLAGHSLMYADVPAGPSAPPGWRLEIALGRFYPLFAAVTVAALALAFAVVVRAVWRAPAGASGRRPGRLLVAGTGALLAASVALLVNAWVSGVGSVDALARESALQPLMVAGALLTGLAVSRDPGLPESRLLRSDLKASLLGSTLVMVACLVLASAARVPPDVLARYGWLVLVVFVLGDEVRRVADRAVFGAGRGAARAGLRTAAAYAGSAARLDVDGLSGEQRDAVIAYLSEMDRAALASARLEGTGDVRVGLLAREEFVAVRSALGLPPSWTPAEGIPVQVVRERVGAELEPRERQALGLKYLGYADKEMARLMGVRQGVPRSYLGEGKRKLGLPAGPSLMLFVHFAGLVETDAIALLTPAAGAAGAGGGAGEPAASGDEDGALAPVAEKPGRAAGESEKRPRLD